MTRWFPPVLLLIIAVALAFRLPGLDQRPMHNDEGVNAVKFRGLWERNDYRYDPHEFHGPTLPFATLPSARLSSSTGFNHFSEATFRIVPALVGTGLILLLLLLADGLGRPATLIAAAFTAVSPAMVYYSRYYIHEMLLVFFSALVLGAGWRYSQTGRLGWCLLAGLGIGLMYATKETFVFVLFALAMAVAGELAWRRWIEARPVELRTWLRVGHLLPALLAATTVSLLLFTSLLKNPGGPLDSITTYSAWINRAGGDSPHVQPWYFYFRRLLFFHYPGGPYWSEALILILAVAGGCAGFRNRVGSGANRSLVRVLALYSFLLAAIYTVIPYKTPWCALGFWQGAILLAGVGAVSLVRGVQPVWLKGAFAGLLLLGGVHLTWQAWRANFVFSASPFNPYVYAHTSPDLVRLVDRVEALAQFSPAGSNMVVKVMAPANDYWPLPWYLRKFRNSGWWGQVPPEPFAPVMIVSSKLEAGFDERPDRTHLMAGYFQLRPQVFLELYVEVNLWKEYVKSLPPEKD